MSVLVQSYIQPHKAAVNYIFLIFAAVLFIVMLFDHTYFKPYAFLNFVIKLHSSHRILIDKKLDSYILVLNAIFFDYKTIQYIETYLSLHRNRSIIRRIVP